MEENLLILKDVLKNKGKTGKWLAEKTNVTEATISNIVKGNHFPKPQLLSDIAFVLDVDIRELFKSTKPETLETFYKKDEHGNEIEIGYLKK